MKPEEAIALLEALKNQMRCGREIPQIDPGVVARRYITIILALEADGTVPGWQHQSDKHRRRRPSRARQRGSMPVGAVATQPS